MNEAKLRESEQLRETTSKTREQQARVPSANNSEQGQPAGAEAECSEPIPQFSMFRFIYLGGKIGRGLFRGTKTEHLPLFAIERKLIHLLERKEPSAKLEIACNLSKEGPREQRKEGL